LAVSSSPRQQRFETLYAEHRLQVLAYCTRRIGPVDGPDACSEVFLTAWRRLDDVPQPPKTLPYLYGIAGRVVSNQHRSSNRRGRLLAKLGAIGVTAPEHVDVIVTGVDREVLSAVNGLKPKDREIVMLYTWEDLSREAIAEIMGMTRAAIDQRIHRSYQRLARVLAPRMQASTLNSSPVTEEGGT
jgi:RNA polymerase sigma-70 factor, ECF subfamily